MKRLYSIHIDYTNISLSSTISQQEYIPIEAQRVPVGVMLASFMFILRFVLHVK